ncbi:uncharacterized protein Z518_09095 [Rhinocladiella mackenziei CBS 650.93]|uniref:Rhinocladiella mackenziei CBS 650.93 unplaced genomic scaffold supercont1.7, whole genome shotgun sequence n=1 Tax=Rhinocladiella mackenziei CBS 650.93 TaxID=1442369 RepID=A0A0D2IXQ8_9EURO|nr:uncharacterized protein Z518_09095 [Rhinocladiella mackenziei CBS 650.93]KIX01370.1 hypothetical protein Z518_09095 [Rhinocladiella mackenziei CBS 650.93]
MVTSFEPSGIRALTPRELDLQHGQANRAPAFPLSSPPAETLTSFKPGNGTAALATNNPFLSSDPFTSSPSDDDSGSSSGQDEFHLERYSQDTDGMAQISKSNRNKAVRRPQQNTSMPKPEKKSRPGLNIVTDFSKQTKRSQTDDLVIEQVQSRKPRLGQRHATSIASARAEHVVPSLAYGISEDQSAFGHGQKYAIAGDGLQSVERSKRRIGREVLSRLQELRAARMKAGDSDNRQENMNPPGQSHTFTNQSRPHNKSARTNGYSPGDRSIVIGLSVPENEAEAHRPTSGGDSALSLHTPDTPAIVVTPAEETGSWEPPFSGRARPVSSIYSALPWNEKQFQHNDTPPVPKIPPAHTGHERSGAPAVGASIIRESPDDPRLYAKDLEIDDGNEIDDAENARRASSESQEQILTSETETRRHKSQGWWNLVLSPTLSRKGTLADKSGTKSTETPLLPSVPPVADPSMTKLTSPELGKSPGTLRRFGLASARASVWSRWTLWEKDRDENSPPNQRDDSSPDPKEEEKAFKDSNGTSFASSDSHLGNGLAAEYYHACAVEQLRGSKYFECQNHSCAERLPQLHSIFDSKSLTEPFAEPRNVNRPVETVLRESNILRPPGRQVQSGVTIQSEPEELSPNVRQADTATVVKARSIDTPEPAEETRRGATVEVPATSQTNLDQLSSKVEPPPADRQHPNIATGVPSHRVQPAVLSPGPVSPAMQRVMTSQGAVPMAEMSQPPSQVRSLDQTHMQSQLPARYQAQPSSITVHNQPLYSGSAAFGSVPVTKEARKETVQSQSQPMNSTRDASQAPSSREEMAKGKDLEDGKKQGFLSKVKGLLSKIKSKKNEEPQTITRRWTFIISMVLLLMVIACILLATLITRTGDGTPVQSQWLNLTGYPPIPTGISTIARPDAVKQESQCVAPTTLWSCALPKESQAEIAPNNPNQPNFRFEITFRNGTVPANMTIPVDTLSRRSTILKERANDPFTNDLFEPNPDPPSRGDQIFMGNTTDNITQPFEGEQTPFFITFIPVFPVDPSSITESESNASALVRRQATNSSDVIPAPDVLADGSAAPANLLPTAPYPTSQPIKLYNRGQVDEHYGFYMYYDKAIFLHSTAPINTSEFSNNAGIDPEDENGGSTRDESRLRCTFSQTRFLVRMWTNSAFGATLLAPTGDVNSTSSDPNSATDFNRPGSFPYPTTLSLDRHGGNINKKAVYCYGVDDLQVIQEDVKSIVPEARGLGGQLINPAPPLVNGSFDSGSDSFEQDAGGIDGGTGGCECAWQNWN